MRGLIHAVPIFVYLVGWWAVATPARPAELLRSKVADAGFGLGLARRLTSTDVFGLTLSELVQLRWRKFVWAADPNRRDLNRLRAKLRNIGLDLYLNPAEVAAYARTGRVPAPTLDSFVERFDLDRTALGALERCGVSRLGELPALTRRRIREAQHGSPAGCGDVMLDHFDRLLGQFGVSLSNPDAWPADAIQRRDLNGRVRNALLNEGLDTVPKVRARYALDGLTRIHDLGPAARDHVIRTLALDAPALVPECTGRSLPPTIDAAAAVGEIGLPARTARALVAAGLTTFGELRAVYAAGPFPRAWRLGSEGHAELEFVLTGNVPFAEIQAHDPATVRLLGLRGFTNLSQFARLTRFELRPALRDKALDRIDRLLRDELGRGLYRDGLDRAIRTKDLAQNVLDRIMNVPRRFAFESGLANVGELLTAVHVRDPRIMDLVEAHAPDLPARIQRARAESDCATMFSASASVFR